MQHRRRILLHFFSLFQEQPYCLICICETLAHLTSAGISHCFVFFFLSLMLVVTLLELKARLMETHCKIFCAYLNQFQKMWVKHDDIFLSVCFLCHCQRVVLEATPYIVSPVIMFVFVCCLCVSLDESRTANWQNGHMQHRVCLDRVLYANSCPRALTRPRFHVLNQWCPARRSRTNGRSHW